jgi:hypothetical protein
LDLVLAPDERGQLGGQVVGPLVEGPDGREVGLEAIDDELGERLRPQVLEPVLAEVAERDPRRKGGAGQGPDALRDEDLAAVPRARHAGRPVDVVANVRAVGVDDALAGVEAHPDADHGVWRPRLGGEGALGVHGRRDGRRSPGEGHEEAVTLRPDLHAVVGGQRRPDDRTVAVEQGRPAIGELAHQARGALDIGEEEGDRPGGERGARPLAGARRLVGRQLGHGTLGTAHAGMLRAGVAAVNARRCPCERRCRREAWRAGSPAA